VTRYGLAGFGGALVFTASFAVLHVARPEMDWTRDYISYFVHGRLGWLFVWGIIVHGAGNVALAIGLYRSLRIGRFRSWAAFLFCAAAAGVVLTAILPIDPIGSPLTLVGRAHSDVAYMAFLSELAALFLFSAAFAQDPVWRRRSGASFVLSTTAAATLTGFVVAASLDFMPGVAERVALASFMAWEFWASLRLVQQSATPGDATSAGRSSAVRIPRG